MKNNLNEGKADNIIILYLFALIRHENIQNFENKFNYLKLKFNFDYQKGQIGAIIKCFPKSKLVLCWFHALQNIKKEYHS